MKKSNTKPNPFVEEEFSVPQNVTYYEMNIYNNFTQFPGQIYNPSPGTQYFIHLASRSLPTL